MKLILKKFVRHGRKVGAGSGEGTRSESGSGRPPGAFRLTRGMFGVPNSASSVISV